MKDKHGRQPRPTSGANEAATRSGNRTNRPGRFVRPMTRLRSAFITTRCYSPTGQLLWDADHGSDVYALAVDTEGRVYQSGRRTNYNLGDSLFHRADGNTFPQVTCLSSSGQPIWSIDTPIGNGEFCYGICITPDRNLYYGLNSVGPEPSYIKKATHTGTVTGTLTDTGFYHGLTGPFTWYYVERVRCDAAGNIYANVRFHYIGVNVGETIWKWVNDVFGWRFQWVDYQAYSMRGLSVADDGTYACVQDSSGGASGVPNPDRNLTIGGEKIDSPLPGDNELFARLTPDGSGTDGCYGVASSPNGRVLAKREDGALIEVTPVGGYATPPTVTVRATVTGLIDTTPTTPVQPGQAVAINDSGQIVYSVDRATTGKTHEIRDASNTVLLSADHGGVIRDAWVSPTGKVIVAGKRVPR